MEVVAYWAAQRRDCWVARETGARLGTCSRHLANIDAIRRRRHATWGRRATAFLAALPGEHLDVDLVVACIASGADIRTLEYAQHGRVYSFLEYVLAYEKFDVADVAMRELTPTTTAILLAISTAELPFIAKLLDVAPAPDLPKIMHRACTWDRLDVAAELVRRFPAVRDVFPHALHHAVQQLSLDIAELLLEAGADPNGMYSGRTPLLLMASPLRAPQLWHDFLALLVRYGADVDAPTPYSRRTLLHKCVIVGEPARAEMYADRIRALLAAGADRTLRDRSWRTPLDIARSRAICYCMVSCYSTIIPLLLAEG